MLIRRLTTDDAEAFLPVRREALELSPLSFGSSPEDDRAGSLAFVRESLGESDRAMFGAFDPGLVGIAGINRERGRKSAHKCRIYGVFVKPRSRGQGVARRLLQEALGFARSLEGVTHVHLSVTEDAPAARRLYQSLGFRTWGSEPAGLRVEGHDVREYHMVRVLDEPGRAPPEDTTVTRRLISSGSTFERDIGYSRAVVDGEWVFVSGTTGFDYETMTIPDGIVAQAERCLGNIETALRQAGASFQDVVRVTYVVPHAAEFPQCWPVLRQHFGEVRPAAMMISAGLADPRMRIEIEVTARIHDHRTLQG